MPPEPAKRRGLRLKTATIDPLRLVSPSARRDVEREAARALHPLSVAWLPIGDIVETPQDQNSRLVYDVASIAELTESVKEHGVLQPILVRPTTVSEATLHPLRINGVHAPPGYVVVAGNRRLKAARLAGLQEVPCAVKVTTHDSAFVLNVVENVQRRELTGRERVRAITLLASFKDEQDRPLGVREISRRTGLATGTISEWLRIQRRPALRAAVEAERIDIGRAMAMASTPEECLDEVLERAPSLSQQELAREVAIMKRDQTVVAKRVASVNQRRIATAYRLLMLVDEVDTRMRDELALLGKRVKELSAM